MPTEMNDYEFELLTDLQIVTDYVAGFEGFTFSDEFRDTLGQQLAELIRLLRK